MKIYVDDKNGIPKFYIKIINFDIMDFIKIIDHLEIHIKLSYTLYVIFCFL